MAGFGYIWFLYLILVLLEVWLVFRPDIVAQAKPGTGAKQKISSILSLGVLAMRWNVVIGGQLVSKSLRGFTSYVPPLTGEAGILMAGVILLLPLVFFLILSYLLPPWPAEPQPSPVASKMKLWTRF